MQKVAAEAGHPLEAFGFVQQGLEFTVNRIHGEDDTDAEPTASRHVSGEQLCHGLRDFAVQQYGLLARTVLSRWNIESCEDFGNIVFAMVNAQILAKTEDDSVAEFCDVFDFDDAFQETLTLSETS
jgi:uncharacterized repeat protein (TIGR04138 family)